MAPRQSAQQRARNNSLTVLSRIAQVVAYGRTSSDLQRETETIKVQVVKLHGSIKALDNPELPESDRLKLLDSFWDDGVSGTVPLQKRAEGQRLVRLICDRGDIQCEGRCSTPRVVDQMWITKLDRLARKLQILIDVEAFLRRHGVALVCMDPKIDTSTETGRLVFTVLGAISEWERGTILERTTNGKHQKASEGKWVGGRKAFGYRLDEHGHLAVDESTWEPTNEAAYKVIQSIFENIGLHESTAWREAQRVGLSERRVQLIIHNPRYKGVGGIFDKDGEWTNADSNPPPAIVTPELWDQAERQLTNNRRNSSRNRHYDYLLTRVLTCQEPHGDGICGRVFAGRTEARHKYDARYTYYYCSRQRCTAKMLRAGDVEHAVWEHVKDALRNPDKYLAQVKDDDGAGIEQLRAELTLVVAKLTTLASERENVNRSAERGMRTWDEAEARVKQILSDAEHLKAQQAALELQIRSATFASFDARRAAITQVDIATKLDEIEASNDRERMGELIRSVVQRADVRTVDGRPVVKLVLRLGPELLVDPHSCPEGSDSPQELLIGAAEIVLPANKPGPKCAA